ncbi:MAG: hypothetical protein ACUVTL_09230 [Thermoproteota archaeon]
MWKERVIFAVIVATILLPAFLTTAKADPSNIVSSINSLIDRIFDTIEGIAAHLAQRTLSTGIFIARVAYLALIIVGIVLRYTGLSSYGGRNMIVGGLVLALVSEIAAQSL